MPTVASKTILVVDDEENLRGLLHRYLESRGFEVDLAANGREALERIAERVPDLILTDIYMPDASGKELIASVTASHPGLPIVAMTGQPRVGDAVDMMKAGVCDYLAKPLQLDRLDAIVHSALARVPAEHTPAAPSLPVGGPPPPGPDDLIAGYRIHKLIGRGSMGLVYLASRADNPDAPRVALKLLSPTTSQGESETLQRRFLREAEIASRVHHPAIVTIIEYGIVPDRNLPYIVLEYVHGESLERIIDRERPLTYEQKATIIRQLADALDTIHSHDLCHRDIKPSNVIVDDQMHPRITDFGLVRVPNSDLTGTYKVVGTPAYLAPESYRHAIVDARVDLFALGVTAYELFLGTRPFDSVIFANLVTQIESELPLEPRKLDPHFPIELQLILARLLKKDPDHRYQLAGDVTRDLANYLDSSPHRLGRLRNRLRHWRSRDWR